jgi:hypothetical protein
MAVCFLDGFDIVTAEVVELGPETHVDDAKMECTAFGLRRVVSEMGRKETCVTYETLMG